MYVYVIVNIISVWQIKKKGKKRVAMGTKFFIALGVFSVALLTYQVWMFCAANWRR